MILSVVRHGTAGAWQNARCRCERCRAYNAESQRAWKARQPYVEVSGVRVSLVGGGEVRLAIADPPYPGQAAKHYADHPDFAGEVDHLELLKRLDAEYDGWALHTSSVALGRILAHAVTLELEGFRKDCASQ